MSNGFDSFFEGAFKAAGVLVLIFCIILLCMGLLILIS